jgi:fibronectin type 3 domain-containing protein
MNVKLSNTGTASAAISAINFSGPFSLGTFAVPFNLAANANISIPLIFTPVAAGNATGSASIVSNAPNSPLVVNLSGTSVLSHSVDLSWNASSTPGVTYAVFRSTQSGGQNPQSPLASNLTGTTFTDTTVQSGQTYFYVIAAVDSTGTESPFSNEATAQVPTP